MMGIDSLLFLKSVDDYSSVIVQRGLYIDFCWGLSTCSLTVRQSLKHEDRQCLRLWILAFDSSNGGTGRLCIGLNCAVLSDDKVAQHARENPVQGPHANATGLMVQQVLVRLDIAVLVLMDPLMFNCPQKA